jgi:membrane protease YdiL (CAAX protease family)
MLAGTFAEELAFRFFIPANLWRLGYSVGRICVTGSILFSLMHLLNLVKGEYDFFGVLNQLVFAFFMGILLFSIYYLTGSLVIAWIYHFLANLPGRLSALQQTETIAGDQGGGNGLLASLVMLLFLSPLIIISLYYLRKIRKDDRVNHKGGNMAQSLFDSRGTRASSIGGVDR